MIMMIMEGQYLFAQSYILTVAFVALSPLCEVSSFLRYESQQLTIFTSNLCRTSTLVLSFLRLTHSTVLFNLLCRLSYSSAMPALSYFRDSKHQLFSVEILLQFDNVKYVCDRHKRRATLQIHSNRHRFLLLQCEFSLSCVDALCDFSRFHFHTI